jgi:hypothetical protein
LVLMYHKLLSFQNIYPLEMWPLLRIYSVISDC